MERSEIRCRYCGKLLGKGDVLDIEIKCPRCRNINRLRAKSPNFEPPDDLPEKSDARICR